VDLIILVERKKNTNNVSAPITDLNERFSDVTLNRTTHKHSTKSSAQFFIVKKKLYQSKANKKGQNTTKKNLHYRELLETPAIDQ
jgi:DNA-binding protein